MADWLAAEGVTNVAMESTGVFWKPIFNILEGRFTVLLVNARHLKQVPGRKSDVRDCQWIAQLLQCGLLKGSFIPPRAQRELRDLTRHRTQLVEEKTRTINRMQKVLEDANIKLASVATDILGSPGRRMLEAMIEGQTDVEQLADLAKTTLRRKIPQLRLALDGSLNQHHRFWLRQMMDHLEFLEGKIFVIEQEIDRRSRPYEDAIALWITIPGIRRLLAITLVAEIGVPRGSVSYCLPPGVMGGPLPRQQRERRKTKVGQNPEGERLATSSLM
jgi:transposase